VVEHRLPKPRVAGSNPVARSNPHPERVFAISTPSEPVQKADAHPLRERIDAFLLAKQLAGCTVRTLQTYRWWLERFAKEISEATPLTVRMFFLGLQSHSPSHQHQAYRTLKTFFRWCLDTGAVAEDPLRGVTMRTPKTLPQVPTGDELRAVIAACSSETLAGIRNRALILTLADSALRACEVLHLLVEDWRPTDRGLFVRAGKGRKDRVSFIGPTATRSLKTWLSRHSKPREMRATNTYKASAVGVSDPDNFLGGVTRT
jgi:site-specific recombinase XerD